MTREEAERVARGIGVGESQRVQMHLDALVCALAARGAFEPEIVLSPHSPTSKAFLDDIATCGADAIAIKPGRE